MIRCIRIAGLGTGQVSPNPRVGCVITKDGRIIGEGYHQNYGGPHAEVNAIRSATEDVSGATVYVNLEPCNIQGKTPPCTDLLIEKRVKKVFAAMLDPNPRVNGKGIEKLRQAGIEVEVGLCADAARRLNESFTKFITTGLPFVVAKIAQSLDGKIALTNGKSKYITSEASLTEVHRLRSEYDAVLVGAGTIKTDDPQLTVRLVDGRSPRRIILDGRLSSPAKSKVFNIDGSRTTIFYSLRIESKRETRKKLVGLQSKGVQAIGLKTGADLNISPRLLLKQLARMEIGSVMLEGGVEVFSSFLGEGLVDKIFFFVAPRIIGSGKGPADKMSLKSLAAAKSVNDIQYSQVGRDILISGYLAKKK